MPNAWRAQAFRRSNPRRVWLLAALRDEHRRQQQVELLVARNLNQSAQRRRAVRRAPESTRVLLVHLGNAPELDAPSPAGDLATRLADLDETVSRVGSEPAKEEDLPKDLVEQEQALAGLRARLEHARLEGARLRALAETSPPATAEINRDEDASDGDAAPSHADLARLVDLSLIHI